MLFLGKKSVYQHFVMFPDDDQLTECQMCQVCVRESRPIHCQLSVNCNHTVYYFISSY